MTLFSCDVLQGARKLSHQRKNQIKALLLAKAREDLKLELQQKAEEKKAALASRLEPLDDLNSKSQQELMVSFLITILLMIL